jgi:hypothetical protein
MAKNDNLQDLLNEIKLRYQLNEEYFDSESNPLSISYQSEDVVDYNQLEFTLQLKIFELQRLTDFLENISLKTAKERSKWLASNQQVFTQLTQLIIHNSNLSLIALQSDSNNSQLSLNLAKELKKAISLMNAIFYDERIIDG